MSIIYSIVCVVKQQRVQVKGNDSHNSSEKILQWWQVLIQTSFSKHQRVTTEICMISKLNMKQRSESAAFLRICIDPWTFGPLKLQIHPVLHKYIKLFLAYVLQHTD